MNSKGRVQSIDRAIAVLNCFSLKRQELRLTEIADELDLNKSTAHGIITTLKYHGLIDQDEESQKYRLGFKNY
jgi:IclR family KDG regulon transcriptional repressor